MFKIVVAVFAVMIALVLAYAATRPDTLHVERSVTINAPAEKIFPLINDIHAWRSWSPWEKLDPAMKRTYSGAAEGPGAVYEWEGNSKAGQGRMRIAQALAPSSIRIDLDFVKPIAGHDVASFKLLPRDGATEVVWSLDSPSPYMTKLAGLFLNMDRLIGRDFEAGLANLKAQAERRP